MWVLTTSLNNLQQYNIKQQYTATVYQPILNLSVGNDKETF